MDESQRQQFLDRVKIEGRELREDLTGMPIFESKKVGDFGCGWGYTTWCLMEEISNANCIGIDKFDPENPPTLNSGFTLENVQNWYKEIGAKEYPNFMGYDIVNDKNLPADFDFIYCKRVLYNIFISDKRRCTMNCLQICPIMNGLRSYEKNLGNCPWRPGLICSMY